jgi:hypothetical protein
LKVQKPVVEGPGPGAAAAPAQVPPKRLPRRAQDKKAGGLPASIQNVPLDELQRMFVDSLKKLKARDKRIGDLAAAHEAAAADAAALREQLAARDAAAAAAAAASVGERLEVGAPLLDRVSAPMVLRIPLGRPCSCLSSSGS